MPVVSASAMQAEIRRLGLMGPEQLAAAEKLVQGRCADARALAKLIVQRGWLTRFQAERLIAGRGQELRLGPYLLLDLLGSGGLSQVFKARHREHGQLVALKLVRPEMFTTAEGRRQFLLELEAMAELDHPNIVGFCDADEVDGTFYYAMEFVEGVDLGRIVQGTGPLPVPLACDLVRQVALGLQHAHERNLVHRDIKPVNLLLVTSMTPEASLTGSRHRVRILDWGLASLRPPGRIGAADAAPGLMGTPNYLAPEQAENANQADIRSDIYSLGCTLYFLLTGEPPFPDGTVEEKIVMHREQAPPPLEQFRDDVPADLAAVLKRMLAKKPADRFQTPAAVSVALLSFSHARPLGYRPGTSTRPSDRTPLPGSLGGHDYRTIVLAPRPVAEPTRHPAADTAFPE